MYDKHLEAYQKASVKISTSLAFLNSGQTVIYSSALTLAMFLAAQGVVKGGWPTRLLSFGLTTYPTQER